MQADRSDTPLTIGIDLGTQSVRVACVEEDGTVAASGAAPLSSIRTEGLRHEQDPEAWWEAVGEAARQATEELGGREITGLAICSTSGTFLLADAGGSPLTPAFMYNDGRAEGEARLAQEAGEEVWNSLGYRMQRSFALPKLLWLLRSGSGKGAARFMHQADFVASQLAGEPVASDWSHALKTGYDLINDRWPIEVFDRLGVPLEIMPPVERPGSTIAEVSEAAAEHTGLPAGTAVRAGMTDGCAAQIPAGASNTGAGVISQEFPGRDLKELGEKAERHGPAATVVYPLTAEGERFPFANSEARGFQLGEPEDETDYYRAILEGVAFLERLCFAHLESLGAEVSGPVALTGGGAMSPVWSQIRADVLELPVVIPRSSEGSVGMAILAHAGEGSVAEAAARMSGAVTRFEPGENRDGRLAENFDRLVTAFVERGYISTHLAKRARMV